MEKEKILRRLVIKAFHVDKVKFEDKTSYEKGTLILNKSISKELVKSQDFFKSIDISIINPGDHDKKITNIMDIIPISTKVLGNIGDGITHTLTGVSVMLTGAFEDDKKVALFGAFEGPLSKRVFFDRAGTPSTKDYIIHVDVILKSDTFFTRKITSAVHKVCDEFIQCIREELKKIYGRNADETHEFFDKISPNKKKVVIIKQVGGQGALHDNQLLPQEPSGYIGGKSNIDLGNVPIILSPNEYRDGALKAMT
ncbi:proline reductase cluster protein PrdD [Tepidibacter hydrothermalis]|uniref:Proline reductase cluster protein PrdD n=1 Tax=Tepidibacter hydrothermalis TaxID=3036126 RepID=A0ABY8EKR7_9FIRM|nr:proline reductase cluster protein PrdD [Tepidibacter hydrothermalis]WFD11865.1 proline reductase cluster protein PrdD [Tepidibacter hydrothermalis]